MVKNDEYRSNSAQLLYAAIDRHKEGNLEAAEPLYRAALDYEPKNAHAWHLLGVVAHQLGRHDVAVEYISQAIEIESHQATFYSNLGEAYRASKLLSKAIACFEQSLKLNPMLAEVHYNLGNALKDVGRCSKAIASYRRAIELRPNYYQAWNNLGNALLAERNAVDAMAALEQSLKINRNYVEAHNNLGLAYQSLRRNDDAEAPFRRAVQLSPRHPAAATNLGNLLCATGRPGDAIEYYAQALKCNPDLALAHHNLGFGLQRLGRLMEAEASFRRAIELKPDYVDAYNNIGVVLKDQGRLEDAIEAFRNAIQYDTQNPMAISNLLLTLQYVDGITLERLAVAHQEFNDRHTPPLHSTWTTQQPARCNGGPLRIGFISPDFHCHPVGYFFIRILENLDPRRCQSYCYHLRRNQDRIATRCESAATVWRNVTDLSYDSIAKQIREDQIDILFDLAGHTAHNRLLVFARRPAPIQITWLGYEGTTGLDAIDFILADRYVIPDGKEQFYREKVLRMPHGYVCYDPPFEAPDISPLPALRNGIVHFGSFNNLAKITTQTIRTWSEVLHRVPDSRLTLKYRGLGDEGVRQRFQAIFDVNGISESRLDFLPPGDYAEYLATYGNVDIALDPLPFGGGITTCDSLWMGVPVITMPGETFASRHSMSHLMNAGITETIAKSRDDYIELVVALAKDFPRLANLRTQLRERVRNSPLCDGRRFANDLMDILENL